MKYFLKEKTCEVKVSVVIPVYNQYESLLLVLKAFSKQSVNNLLYEVIIIDDGSNDNLKDTTINDFGELGLKIKIVHQKNLGRAASRNSGVKISSGDIIIFCDADRIPDPDFVKEHLEWHNMGRNIVIGYPYDFYGKKEMLLDCINWKLIRKYSRLPIFYSKIFESYFGSIKSNSNLSWLSFLVGNSSISKIVFEKYNGFDESFREWGFEHFEFAFRLYKSNETFYLNSKACNFHIPHKRKENFYQQSIKNNINKIHNLHEEIDCDVLLKAFFSDIDLRELEKKIIKKIGE